MSTEQEINAAVKHAEEALVDRIAVWLELQGFLVLAERIRKEFGRPKIAGRKQAGEFS